MSDKKILFPAERLIVAADFDPREVGGTAGVKREFEVLLKKLKDSGVTIKVNSVLRLIGFGAINMIHGYGLKAFSDLKLKDIPKTMGIDAACLAEYGPDFLTVMADADAAGMQAVVDNINPGCEIMAVTVLTSFGEARCRAVYKDSVEQTFISLGNIAKDVAGIGGLILSPLELEMAKSEFGNRFTLNTPGIRPAEKKVKDDDQERISTPAGAIAAGATRIIVGRPITQAQNPLAAALRIISEIQRAKDDLEKLEDSNKLFT